MPFLRVISLAVFTIFVGFLRPTACAQRSQHQMPEKSRLLFVLDGSGSMRAEWNGESRWEMAKKVMGEIIDSLKVNSKVEIGLRVYGHQFDRNLKNCQDSKLEIGFAPNNHKAVVDRLASITPQGTTPIAYSLEQAANDFPPNSDTRNIIVMITDGIESCEGDPCAISQGLQKNSVYLRPFIVGLGMEEQAIPYFGCMGKFYNALDINGFRKALTEIMRQSLARTTVTVELQGANGKPTETNVNMTFVNKVTGKAAYDYVHYRNAKGLTDTLDVDAILTYDLVVNTVPAIRKDNISFSGGKHTTIEVKIPQGDLMIDQKGYMQFAKPLFAKVKKAGSEETLVYHQVSKQERYLIGKYDLEVPTLPITRIKGIEVKEGKTTTINLPQPGSLNIINRLFGFGSIYLLDKGKAPTWIYNFTENKAQMTLALLPGIYRIVFRTDEAVGSAYTIVKEIEVKSGEDVVVNLLR